MAQVFRKWLPVTAAFGLLMGLSALPAHAQDAKPDAKGSVSGTVTDKDGKAIEGVTVNLLKPRGRRGGGGANGGGGTPPPPPPADKLQNRPAPVATATTDKDGKYEMKDVPVGNYAVMVRDTDKKAFGRAMVKVEDGQTATADIKCSDTPPQRGGGGGGGGGAGGGAGGNPPPPPPPQ